VAGEGAGASAVSERTEAFFSRIALSFRGYLLISAFARFCAFPRAGIDPFRFTSMAAVGKNHAPINSSGMSGRRKISRVRNHRECEREKEKEGWEIKQNTSNKRPRAINPSSLPSCDLSLGFIA